MKHMQALLFMNNYLSLIKFSHTIFALPFALLGFFLGVTQIERGVDFILLAKVVACMVFARSAAMAFNRYIDRDIDLKNPRTASREIPAGIISSKNALIFVVVNSLLFCVVTFSINKICFYLSPVALLVVLGYSYTKRFTALCHFILGIGLALAPIGAYLAVTGYFSIIPILYSFVVLFWVAGFDIIYALQDVGFDRANNLNSLPAKLGQDGALFLSNTLHFLSGSLMLVAGYLCGETFSELFLWHWLGAFLFIAMLFYQHLIVKPGKLDRINLAFFTTNGVASILFSTIFIIDILT